METEGLWVEHVPTRQERAISDDLQVVLAMRVAYNGTPFSGFAKQPGQLTVQGSLEEALAMIFRHPVETVCSGRTDSGVHARGQWVSFSLTAREWNERSEYRVLKSLNALTHDAISVYEICRKDLDFSARFSARSREYRYFICTDKPAPLLMNGFCWHLGKELDLEAMRAAAKHLIGEHDFRSFCMAASAEGKTTNRNVVSITVEPEQVWGENMVVVTVVGNAFLHSMVRTIVGTLVMVGLGKREPGWVAEVLEARNRSAAGENAPACGLVFWKVNYDGELIYDPRAKEREEQERIVRKAAKSKRFRLFADHEASFAIPRGPERGEGELPMSGSALSEVKLHEEGEDAPFDEADVSALLNPACVAGAAEVTSEPAPAPEPEPAEISDEIWPANAEVLSYDGLGELEFEDFELDDEPKHDFVLLSDVPRKPCEELGELDETDFGMDEEPAWEGDRIGFVSAATSPELSADPEPEPAAEPKEPAAALAAAEELKPIEQVIPESKRPTLRAAYPFER